jgi:hypothetical protein
MVHEATPEVYQLHVWIRQISPMIGRRLLVRSDSTLAQLHHTLQIAFGWSDLHLHRFRIHGRNYGISRVGGPSYSQDAHQVRLDDFQFRHNERFLYEYDFGDAGNTRFGSSAVSARSRGKPPRSVSEGGARRRRKTAEVRRRSWNAATWSRGESASTWSRSSRA